MRLRAPAQLTCSTRYIPQLQQSLAPGLTNLPLVHHILHLVDRSVYSVITAKYRRKKNRSMFPKARLSVTNKSIPNFVNFTVPHPPELQRKNCYFLRNMKLSQPSTNCCK